MKRFFSFLLCLVLLFSLCGCSLSPGSEENDLGDLIDLYLEDVLTSGNPSSTVLLDPVTGMAFNYLTGNFDLAPDRVGLRPACVSVNNRIDSLPQSGISKADVIVEIETEGGITRLMCLFSDYRDVEKIGSVRSLRDQFIEVIFPVDPIIVHIGTSIFADAMLQTHNLNTIDGGWVPSVYFRDPTRTGSYIWEHTAMTTGDRIARAIEDAKIDERSGMTIDSYFNFIPPDEVYLPASGTASAIQFRLSITTTYEGDFRYDPVTNKYLKYECNREHYDQYYDQQLAFDNVFIVFADFSNRTGTELIEVHYQNGGRGVYLSNGRYEEVVWTKGDYATPIEFWRADGSPLPVNTGQSIICVARSEYYDTINVTP